MGRVREIVEAGTAAEQTALVTFAKGRHIEENLGFMWAVISYTKLATKTATGNVPIAVAQIKGIVPFEQRGGANTMGKWVYDTYVDPKSPLTVNITSDELRTLKTIADTRSSPFTPPDFDDAYETIAKLVDSQQSGKYEG